MSGVAWIAFVVAAGAGAATRSVVDAAVSERSRGRVPWGTIAVNIGGSLLLGVLTGMSMYHGLSEDVAIVLGVGFCGAVTTFSTFGFETVRLMQEGAGRAALGNLLVTVITCGVAAGIGIAATAI